MTEPIPFRLRGAALLAAAAWTNLACATSEPADATASAASGSYDDLVALFEDWRAFERPPLLDGAPDYTARRMAAAHAELPGFFDRLHALAPDSWSVEQRIDWHLVRAELNGFDFNCRVLRPWERDPAFYQTVWTYQSDVPAHEGPTNHALLELWTYTFPLTAGEEARLAAELGVIPPLLAQARGNLTGDAGDLFRAGIETLRQQVESLEQLAARVDGDASEELSAALGAALRATRDFMRWAEAEAPSRTGPSGVGRENYTWYLQNVHLVPLTWEDEVRLLERELARAWSSLKLEEQRNRHLPELVAAASPEEYDARADAAASRLMAFLDERGILPVKPNMEPALREHLGRFVPEPERNFFWIGAHYDPTPLYTHFYHWWDLAQIRDEPHASPIRRGPLLYNIFDSRAEGTATGVEEMFLHAGLYDEQPRSREIVWILLAQRAARGLGSLYAHANEMTMAEAGTVHVAWTPRGWMNTEPELLRFEQHLYLRQPGYGTSYITGKFLLEQLLASCAQQADERGEDFVLRDFFAELNAAGVIPLSLIRWQMTGLDDQIRELTDA
ncbi:MAG: hypothetical protein AAF682_18965 [Planctomycetota bacterium]